MNNTRDNGGPAYPCGREWNCDRTEVSRWEENGKSLLDYFAGLAMQSIIMRAEVDALSNNRRAIAGGAYQIAEEMIAEKRRREGGGT